MKILLALLFSCFLVHGIAQEAYKDTLATNFFKRTKGVIAMDGGYVVPLSDGRLIWLFGDSYIDNYDSLTRTVPCLFQVRNSALLQPSAGNWNQNETTLLLQQNQANKTFLQDTTQPSHFFWPGAGYQWKDTVYIFCFNMKNVTGGLGFAKAGNDVWMKIHLPQMQVINTPIAVQDLGSIQFGEGIIADSVSGYSYIYGSKRKTDSVKGLPSLSNDIFVARFRTAYPASAWQFWNGNRWTPDVKQSKPIADVPSFSKNISRVNGRYLLLSSDFSLACDQGKNIYASVSDKPTGPFSAPKLIYSIEDRVQGHTPFFYLPIAHPEWINEKNEILVTYSINGYEPCVANCADNKFDPEKYRPQAIRVPLSLLIGKL